MGKKHKRYQNVGVVECKCCNGVVTVSHHMGRGDLLCCDECGAEYLLNARKPLRLELIRDDEEYFFAGDHGNEEYFGIDDIDYIDDGYNDGWDY